MFTQSRPESDRLKDKIEQSMEVSEDVPSEFELQTFLLKQFNHIEITSVKEVLIPW